MLTKNNTTRDDIDYGDSDIDDSDSVSVSDYARLNPKESSVTCNLRRYRTAEDSYGYTTSERSADETSHSSGQSWHDYSFVAPCIPLHDMRVHRWPPGVTM